VLSEGCIELRVVNEGFIEIGNTFRQLVTEVKVTQTGALFGSAVCIEVTVSPVSKMGRNIQALSCGSKVKCPLT
jgi:hypothetical protein